MNPRHHGHAPQVCVCSSVFLLRVRDDSYNKMLAWADVAMELIVGRLYFLVPTLPDVLGGLAPSLQVSKRKARPRSRRRRSRSLCINPRFWEVRSRTKRGGRWRATYIPPQQ